MCYIKFLNKDNNFAEEKKDFNSYAEARIWAKDNFENFNSDMICYY